MTSKQISEVLKGKNAKVESFSGYFYVIDRNTGKRLINKSFRNYEDVIYSLMEI